MVFTLIFSYDGHESRATFSSLDTLYDLIGDLSRLRVPFSLRGEFPEVGE